MATTFIDYNENKGFWIAEIYMELTFEFILQTLEKIEFEAPFKQEFKEDLEFNVNGFAKGMLVLTWHSFIKTNEDEELVIRILNETILLLKEKGEFIPIKELNDYEVKKEEDAAHWPKPFKTAEITKILETLILMLKNEWHETRYGMEIDYSFID